MIQNNNNTPDVAYLGWGDHPIPKSMIYQIEKHSSYNIPEHRLFAKIGFIYVFDCSGTRYGFRIKELKSEIDGNICKRL